MPSTIPGIPDESKALFDRLHDGPLIELAELRAELESYATRLAASTVANELLDATLAEAITQCCKGLLELGEDAPEETRRLVQAAVRYFLVEEDVEPDRDSMWGLDDDAVVCAAVACFLEREDLAEGL